MVTLHFLFANHFHTALCAVGQTHGLDVETVGRLGNSAAAQVGIAGAHRLGFADSLDGVVVVDYIPDDV